MLETKATFSAKIVEFCRANDFRLVEGIAEYCGQVGIEIEDIPSLITNELKALLKKEATDLNILRTAKTKVQFD